MAIEEPQNRIDEFITNYDLVVTEMLGSNSLQERMIKSINDIFQNADIDSQQRGQALTELASNTAIQYNKDAVSAAMEVIKLAPEFEVKSAQRDLLIRQIQGYDDNMLIKVAEQQSGLASFAVNANSDSAQSTINRLNEKLTNIESRVKDLDGINACPIPTPDTPVPQNLLSTNITDTSITVSWDAVQDATLYLVYKDGFLISTQGSIEFIDNNLTPETKYAYSVKASIDGVLSDHTDGLIVSTIATPVES